MNRRRFLWQGGVMALAPLIRSPLGAAQAPVGKEPARKGTSGPVKPLQPLDGGKIGNAPAMKITDIKTFLVGAGGRNWVYVKILTEVGMAKGASK